MNGEYNDDWNPDVDRGDSILNKYVMNFTDKLIKKQQLIEEENESGYFAELRSNLNKHEDNDSSKLSTTADVDREENLMFDFNTDKKEEMESMYEENFYDPLQDEKNEEWIYSNLRKDRDSQPIVLSCPKCFTQLCFECQMHESYENQFRALFAQNCKINLTRTLKPQGNNGKQKENMIEEEEDIANLRQTFEIYFSVECNICSTEVGVYGADSKLYIFFHVLPGLG